MRPVAWVLGSAFAAVIAAAAALSAQGGLRSRIEGGGDARVQFRYAARADVCGAGSTIEIGTSTYISNGSSRFSALVPR